MKELNIRQAVECLARGELVVVPTETVYGLAADGFNADAVEKIFEIKGRPKGNPVILHVADVEMLGRCVKSVDGVAEQLIKNFWPGPLTIVFEKSVLVPEFVTAGLSTVCVRMPNSKIALEIIKGLGRPLAAPSANKSGRPSATRLVDVLEDFEGIESVGFVDGGDCELGLESTVVDLSKGAVTILRLGAVSKEKIEEVSGVEVKLIDSEQQKLRTPGARFKHYSPKGEVFLVYPWEEFGEKVSRLKNSLFATVETAIAEFYENNVCGIICVESRRGLYEGYNVLAIADEFEQQAKNLYSLLRETERLGWEKVVVDMTGVGADFGLGLTIRERLMRASEGAK